MTSKAASNVAESMRRDWDDRARKNAYFYIASWKENWDEESFLQSGEEDYLRFVQAPLQRANFSTADKSMIELGCGAGRMTRSFAQRFHRVSAFDVSPEMIERGRQLHSAVPNVTWVLGNGTDLSALPPCSVDFIFSYLVLQHLPNVKLIYSYIAEMLRVLAQDGLCLFQFNGATTPNMNWKGRTAWGIIDFLWNARLHSASKWTARVLGFDPEMGGKSWHGAPISGARVIAAIRDKGGLILERAGENTPMEWCCAKKDRVAGGLRET